MPTEVRKQKVETLVSKRQQGIMVFEDIYDPHNAAAVLRSCDGFGFHNAYFIFEQQTPWNPAKVGKASSSSANQWLSFETFSSTRECLEKLKNDGYTIMATALNPKAVDFYQCDFTDEKIAMVFGNEHRGVSEAVIEMADTLIEIPMAGMVQSFNISVTAAIVMYEITRQRREKGMGQYTFSSAEQAAMLEHLL